jgi:hypothetical protein
VSTNSDTEELDEDVQTPSHQLKKFLDNIRSSMREPDGGGGGGGNEDNNNTSNYVKEQPTPSDQLRQFLDAIRSNQIPPDSDGVAVTGTTSTNTATMNHHHHQETNEMDNKNKLAANISNTAKTVDQILDNFHLISSDLKDKNSFEYLKKYSDALKQTSEQIRQLHLNYSNSAMANGTICNGGSSDDSSTSTTPNSIKEAVQNLLTQPRNGFQIMDDRMSLFINIMDGQDKFSQVKKMKEKQVCFRHARFQSFRPLNEF